MKIRCPRFPSALLFVLWLQSAWFVMVPAADKAKSVPGPTRWETAITAFEASDKASLPPKHAVLFIGSSSIRMWTNVARDFPEFTVINRGFGGSQIEDSVHFAERIVIPYEPRQIIFYAGGNDINAGKTPARVLSDFKAFVEKVHGRLPETRIAYISIAGNPARWAQVEQVKEVNRMITEYIATNPKLDFINVFPHMLGPDGQPKPDIFLKDRLHMNEKGYAIWKEIIADFLRRKAK
jgi:lysophospholipase L1-like esterase